MNKKHHLLLVTASGSQENQDQEPGVTLIRRAQNHTGDRAIYILSGGDFSWPYSEKLTKHILGGA